MLLAGSPAGSSLASFVRQSRLTCPGNGAAHSGLGLLTSITNQDHSLPTDRLTNQSDQALLLGASKLLSKCKLKLSRTETKESTLPKSIMEVHECAGAPNRSISEDTWTHGHMDDSKEARITESPT